MIGKVGLLKVLTSLALISTLLIWQASILVFSQPKPLTVEQLEQKKKATEADASLTGEIKAKLIELYDQAMTSLQETAQLETRLADLSKKVESGPKRQEEIQQILSHDPSKKKMALEVPSEASLEKIEQLIIKEEANLNAVLATHKEQQAVLFGLTNASRTLREDLADRYTRLEKINTDLASPALQDDAPALKEAHKLALQARKAQRETEIKIFQLQLEHERLLTSLATAEQDLAAANIAELQHHLVALKATAQKLREERFSKVLEKAEEARAQVAGLPQRIRIIADEYVALSAELEQLIRNESKLVARLQSAQLQHDAIRTIYDSTRRRVEVAGPTEAIGRMLRKRLDSLPSVKAYRRAASKRRAEISQATNRQIDIDELRLELSDSRRIAETVIANVPGKPVDEETTRRWSDETFNLLTAKQRRLNELYRIYGRYVSELSSLDVAERQLVEVSKEFVDFIKEQLLWIRSTSRLSPYDLVGASSTITWLFSPLNWFEVAEDFVTSLKLDLLILAGGLLAVVGLLLLRRMVKQRLQELAKLTIKIRTDNFTHTLKALLYTLLLVSGWPALLAILSWSLGKLPTPDTYTLAVSDGLLAAAVVLFTVDLLREICRNNGLAERHFRWPVEVRKKLRRELHWLVITAPLLAYIIMATAEPNQTAHIPTLGRPAFILLMLNLMLLAYRTLRHAGALSQYLRDMRPSHWLTQLRVFWYPLTLLIPFILMLTSSLGYHYSALHISLRILITLWLFLSLMLLKDLLLRSLYIQHRRLKFEEAVHKRDELQTQRMKEEIAAEEETTLPTVEEPEVDYEQLSEQAKRLLSTGLVLSAIVGVWSIWSDMLPALGFLDRMHLPFTATELIDGVEKQVPVTFADIGIGVLIAFLTLFAAKNLPGVLEFSILRHLPLDTGGRYTATTLSQYMIVLIGIIAAFTMIGVEWSSIQWLVAALGVGLGFGLQEIFANFVSGLIILFERPARVGDTVTVADLSGTVTRIRIRATTITDWDRKEIIVPNKSFITEKLINWTLTDPITRVTVPVRIAYGSDTNLAYSVIKETAETNPLVLPEPKLQLFFLGFGDSSLNFELRVFVRQLDDRLPVIHELHMAINEALKRNNIVIPFPQRDIYMRSSED